MTRRLLGATLTVMLASTVSLPAAAQVTMPDPAYVLPTTATIDLSHGTFNGSMPYVNGVIVAGGTGLAIPLVPRINASWYPLSYADIPYDVATQGYDYQTTFIFNQTNTVDTTSIGGVNVITDLREIKDPDQNNYVTTNLQGNFYASIAVDPLVVQLDRDETWNAQASVTLHDIPHYMFKEVIVNDRGYFAADRLYLAVDGALTLNGGGTVSVDEIEGTFNWNGGLLILKDGLTAYSGTHPSSLGSHTVSSGRGLRLTGDSLIQRVDGLVINGGYLQQEAHLLVTQQGSLNHTSGLIIYGDNSVTEFAGISKGYFGSTQNIGRNSTLKINQESDVTMTDAIRLTGASLVVDGYSSTLTTNTGPASYSAIGTSSGTTTATFRNTAKGYFHSATFYVGYVNSTGTNTLHIQSGAQVTTNGLRIGQGASGTSTVNISGTNSKLIQNDTFSSAFYLGSEKDSDTKTSIGKLNLPGGGLLQTSNYSDDTIMRVMHNGIANIYGGTLDARNHVDVIGGTINHTSGSFLLAANKRLSFTEAGQGNFVGDQHFNSGKTLNVSGDSDVIYKGKLIIGQSSGGTLTVDGLGSTLTLGDNTIASNAWGDGTGTTSATFSNSSTTNIDYALTKLGVTSTTTGSIDFNVLSGATVTTNSLALGTDKGLNSTINIDGTNSALTLNGSSSLTAGGANNGWTNINIKNGGALVTGTGDTTLQKKGILTLNQGVLTVNGDLNLNGPSTRINQTAGTINLNEDLNISNASLMQTGGTINFATGKTFTFLEGAYGQFSQDTIAINGDLNVNTDARITVFNLQLSGNLRNELTGHDLIVRGTYSMDESSSLTLSLTAVDQIDGLAVNGEASLDGHLELFDAGLYTAQVGDQLELITALRITGKFDSISLASLPSSLGLKLIYEPNRVIAEVFAKTDVIFDNGFEDAGGEE